MYRYFIHMAYDGTGYSGWQTQPGGNTVQQAVEHALTTLLGEDISVTGAGRTDTGVHASFFVAHFDTPNLLEDRKEDLVFRLNRFLPDDIVIYRLQQVPGEMHARFSATYRTYHYHISTIKPLYTRNYAHYVYGSLNVEEIGRCCEIIMNTDDFTSFSKLHTDVKTNRCQVMAASWKEVDSGYLFEIKADRFLRNMVRSVVGTLLDVGFGKISSEQFRQIVEAKDRSRAGMSAPAKGLFLVDIGYGVMPDRA
ncbi:MAG TPA: tRNA pseudouridine(38-40) synthase TruA [Bacteroides sp.]|nr:tRNA pseudouridine(38-40) synthase TruA [Bacteroides sp.]